MKKKKLLLTLMSLIIVGSIQVNKIDVSAEVKLSGAGTDFGSDFNPISATYRPSEGYLNAGLWFKNPLDASQYLGSGSTYQRNRTHIKNKKISLYGFDIYYYEPVGYGSAQYQGVPENLYAYIKRENYFIDSSYHNFAGYDNRNLSKWQNYPNKYSYSAWKNQTENSIYGKAQNRDPYLGVNGTWRFLGYNTSGESFENPFFPPDGLSSSMTHNSNVGYFWIGIHNKIKPSGAYVPALYASKKSEYDSTFFYNKKVKAIERMMSTDSGFSRGVLNYFTDNTGRSDRTARWIDGGTITAQTWAEVLSLKTNPELETPVFHGYRVEGSNELGYGSVIAPASPDLNADIEVNEIRAYRGNTLVGRYTRDGGSVIYNHKISPGNSYRFEYVVKNVGKSTLNVAPALLDTGFSVNANALQNGQTSKFPENNSAYNSTLKSKQTSKLTPGQTATFERTVSVPDNVRSTWKASAYINQAHEKNLDNLFIENDWGFIRFGEVTLGDFSAEDIYYEDVNGNKVDNIIPGEKYKVCYTFKYTGETLDKPHDLNFEGKITRYLPQSSGASDTKVFKFNKEKVTLTKNMPNLVFKTDLIVFEQPKATAVGTVKIQNDAINSNTKNDSYSESFNDSYDFSVSNVSILPNSEKPLKDETITVGVKYDLTVKSPSYTSKDYDVTTHIKLPDNKVISVTDHVKTGTTKNIVHELQIPVSKLNSGSKNYGFEVTVNGDKKKWEDDLSTQSNNKGKANLQILAPTNPTTFVNNTGCPINTSDKNSWNVTHEIYNFSGNYVSYNKFDGSKTYEFYNYKKGTASNSDKNYNESYNIDSVLFKSKFTTDNKYGSNGWVDLTKASEKDKAKIKAGYGYELQIDVSYKTNVFTNQPKATWNRNNNNSTGNTVSNLQTPANINNDIYVRTSDGKTLSATGMFGTTQAFNSTILSNSKNEVKIRYTMKTKNTNGVTEPLKIFIDENTKDGTYGLNVFTPSMIGVGSSASKKELCDYEKLQFKVQGSMYDDNSDHIVQ